MPLQTNDRQVRNININIPNGMAHTIESDDEESYKDAHPLNFLTWWFAFLNDAITGGPKLRLGTKCPSMMSMCSQSAPKLIICDASVAIFARSQDKREGDIIDFTMFFFCTCSFLCLILCNAVQWWSCLVLINAFMYRVAPWSGCQQDSFKMPDENYFLWQRFIEISWPLQARRSVCPKQISKLREGSGRTIMLWNLSVTAWI